MSTDAPAAENTLLTMEQAVAELTAEGEKEPEAPALAEAAPTEGHNTEAEPAAEDASEPEAVTDGENAETEDAEAEGDKPELPAIEPPRFWDAEQKAWFSELPRDKQEYLLLKETERGKATAKAIEEAALSRKAADGEASKIAQLTGVLDKLLPQAMQTFKSRWENVDWNQVVDQYGAGEALKLRNQMEAEQNQVQQLTVAKDQADAATTARFVADRFTQLQTVCPDLADAKAGPERQLKLVQFLTEQGVHSDITIKRASANELALAYDAMRWRQAQAQAKAKASAPPTPAKPAAQQRPTVRGTAAPTRGGSPQTARYQALSRKSSLTMDESVEMLNIESELAQ